MATRSPVSHKEPAPQISPQDYAAFIAQIELQTLWLQDARLENRVGPHGPNESVEVHVLSEPSWNDRDGGFDATQRYHVQFTIGDAPLAEIEVTFALRFSSARSMTEDIFHVFHDVNLPLNTWPYLREFVSGVTGRMGWLPFTLPALKRGTPVENPSERPPTSSRVPTRRRSVRSPATPS